MYSRGPHVLVVEDDEIWYKSKKFKMKFGYFSTIKKASYETLKKMCKNASASEAWLSLPIWYKHAQYTRDEGWDSQWTCIARIMSSPGGSSRAKTDWRPTRWGYRRRPRRACGLVSVWSSSRWYTRSVPVQLPCDVDDDDDDDEARVSCVILFGPPKIRKIQLYSYYILFFLFNFWICKLGTSGV